MKTSDVQRNIALAIVTLQSGRVDAAVRILERVIATFDEPIEFDVTDDALLKWLS